MAPGGMRGGYEGEVDYDEAGDYTIGGQRVVSDFDDFGGQQWAGQGGGWRGARGGGRREGWAEGRSCRGGVGGLRFKGTGQMQCRPVVCCMLVGKSRGQVMGCTECALALEDKLAHSVHALLRQVRLQVT